MVIDLKRCIGCYACMVACKQEHFLPPQVFWARVVVGETGRYPTVTKQMYPVLCNHCEEAICVKACPTGATSKRDDGLVIVDYDQCVGCRYCLIACPYQQRTFLADEKEYFPGQGLTPHEMLGKRLFPYQKGTVVKCTFCEERLVAGKEKGLTPGTDRDATPACVNVCPVKARTFGDLNDSMSEISRLIKEKKGFQLHPEYGTHPSVYYINP
jgi:molybdopterin-containing oxidoreductase family iron-sulfur binding subunit